MRTVVVSGDGLTVEDVVDVARGEANAELAVSVIATMEPSRAVVAAAIRGDAPVYGVNTGFGALADTRVAERDMAQLQAAIIVSHAAAAGDPLDDETVRAMLLLRARTLAAGYSGVRPDLPARLAGPAAGRRACAAAPPRSAAGPGAPAGPGPRTPRRSPCRARPAAG